MSNQDNISSRPTYNDILELYQKCRRNGDWAKVYLETRGGVQFFTISVNVSAGSAAGATSGMERERKNKKPGQIRRDQNRRTAFLERRRQTAKQPEAARSDEIGEEEAEKTVDIDTGAGETSSEVCDPVRKSSSASSTVCTWDVGLEAPSPGSPQQCMSIDSDTETENEPLDQAKNTAMEKKDNRWRIKVETEEIEKLEQHVKNTRDSKVFRFLNWNPIMSVDSIVTQVNDLVLDVSIDNDQFGIGFIENIHNWPTFVINVKRISRL